MEDFAVDSNISVAEFYAGKYVFLTGATGFVGKMFIEKVLRSCPDVEGIYCLVRDKKGKCATDRIDKMCQGQAFDVLREQNAGFRKKIHIISGNLQSGESLGMSEPDLSFLLEKIHIIVHAAADITFNQPLKRAVESNVLPTQALVRLAEKVQQLEAFVHVSTAYTNCDRLDEVLQEKIYPLDMEPRKIIDLISCLDEEAVESLVPKLIGKHPNTYTFTKRLSEVMLAQEAAGLPLVIVRPTIIVNAVHEPKPGFIDQLTGFSAGMIGLGRGFIGSWYTRPDVILDLVPVDYCVNAIIASAWSKAVVEKGSTQPSVCHVSTSQQNPFTVQNLVDYGLISIKIWPFENGISDSSTNPVTTNKFIHYLSMIFQHLLLGLFLDLILMIVGKKAMLVNIYMKIIRNTSALEYFARRSWVYSTLNLNKMQSVMTSRDKQIFPVDVKNIHWQSFVERATRGIKLYLLKEDLDNIDKVKTFYKRLRWLKSVIKLAAITLISAAMVGCVSTCCAMASTGIN